MKRITHVGVLVHDLEAAIARWAQLFGYREIKRMEVPPEGLRSVFLSRDGTPDQFMVELVQVVDEADTANPVARRLREHGEGMMHLCMVDEDTGVAALKWRNGAMGTINVTMLTYPKNVEGSITILGEKGSVRIGGVAVNEIKHWEFDTPHEMDAHTGDASYQTTSVYGFGHPLYYDNVIKTLRGQSQPETDGREGLKSLELLIAMYLSARDGKRINLPLAY